jgi:hypothetical protein
VAADEAGVRHADAPGSADRFEAQEAFCREAHQDFHEKQVVGEGDAGSRRSRCYPAAFLRASPPMIHLTNPLWLPLLEPVYAYSEDYVQVLDRYCIMYAPVKKPFQITKCFTYFDVD